jgi:hypothetical protein
LILPGRRAKDMAMTTFQPAPGPDSEVSFQVNFHV